MDRILLVLALVCGGCVASSEATSVDLHEDTDVPDMTSDTVPMAVPPVAEEPSGPAPTVSAPLPSPVPAEDTSANDAGVTVSVPTVDTNAADAGMPVLPVPVVPIAPIPPLTVTALPLSSQELAQRWADTVVNVRIASRTSTVLSHIRLVVTTSGETSQVGFANTYRATATYGWGSTIPTGTNTRLQTMNCLTKGTDCVDLSHYVGTDLPTADCSAKTGGCAIDYDFDLPLGEYTRGIVDVQFPLFIKNVGCGDTMKVNVADVETAVDGVTTDIAFVLTRHC